jgi:hypothetical protein
MEGHLVSLWVQGVTDWCLMDSTELKIGFSLPLVFMHLALILLY